LILEWKYVAKLSGFQRSFLSYKLSLVVQFALADMRTMTHMRFACGGIHTQGAPLSFVMSPSFRAALLAMAPFGIWHDL
jgi:hypothetical protein